MIRQRLAVPRPTLADYLHAQAEWDRLRSGMARFFSSFYLLLVPCVPVPVPGHAEPHLTVCGQTVVPRHVNRATLPWDLTGSPALAVPFGWSNDGLPIAVQLVGRHFNETTVLHAGMVLEATGTVAVGIRASRDGACRSARAPHLDAGHDAARRCPAHRARRGVGRHRAEARRLHSSR